MESFSNVLFFPWAIKTFSFWHLSSDCQIACPAFVSGPPQEPILTNLLLGVISLAFFGQYCKLQIFLVLPALVTQEKRLFLAELHAREACAPGRSPIGN